MTNKYNKKEEITGPEMLESYHNYIFDLDGILIHTGHEAIKEFKLILVERLGIDVDLNFGTKDVSKFNQITDWAIERGLSEDDAIAIEHKIWGGSAIYERALPFKGTLAFMGILKEEGKRVLAATSRPHFLADITFKSIDMHIPSLKKSEVYIRADDTVEGAIFKADFISSYAKDKGSTVFIEDLPFQAEQILKSTDSQDVYGILIPYGQIQPSEFLKSHPRLTILEREPETQETHSLFNYIKGAG